MTLPLRGNNKPDRCLRNFMDRWMLKKQRRRGAEITAWRSRIQKTVISTEAEAAPPRVIAALLRKIEALELRIQLIPLVNFPDQSTGNIEHRNVMIALSN